MLIMHILTKIDRHWMVNLCRIIKMNNSLLITFNTSTTIGVHYL